MGGQPRCQVWILPRAGFQFPKFQKVDLLRTCHLLRLMHAPRLSPLIDFERSGTSPSWTAQVRSQGCASEFGNPPCKGESASVIVEVQTAVLLPIVMQAKVPTDADSSKEASTLVKHTQGSRRPRIRVSRAGGGSLWSFGETMRQLGPRSRLLASRC